MVTLSEETFSRLQAHAVPLIDSIETVINRALDALDARGGDRVASAGGGIRPFNPASPPSLSFTTVRSVTFQGKRHVPAETYWNSIMNAAVREAAKRKMSAAEISDLLLVNNVQGRKEDGGYKYIEEAGLSVQGQDANAAWKAAFQIIHALGLEVEVTFVWQNNPKAAYPGVVGSFSVSAQ